MLDIARDSFSVDVTNTNARPGVETVQLYVHDLVGAVTCPVKELKGFHRVVLQPGETRRVDFSLSAESLAFAGPDDRMMLEPGRYQVWLDRPQQRREHSGRV